MAKEKYNSAAAVERQKQQKKERRKELDKIKRNNPEQYALMKEKERQRWKKRREEEKVELIDNLSKTEQNKLRKSRREAVQRYRQRQNNNFSKQNNSTLDSCNEMSPNNVPNIICDTSLNSENNSISRQQKVGRKKVLRLRSKTVRDLKNARIKISDLSQSNKLLQRKIWRLKKKLSKHNNSVEISPESKVRKLMKGKCKDQTIKNELILGEVLKRQIKESANNVSKSIRKGFYKGFSGNIVKKYRMLKKLKSTLSLKQLRRFRNEKNVKITLGLFSKAVKKSVTNFFLRDDVSVCSPGKKECITKNKIKKTKKIFN